MIKVTREKLGFASMYIDTCNPKFELNYLFVDSKHMVSTRTRAIAIVEHGCEVEEDFYIQKSIVELALKQTKAMFFILEPNRIICLDRDDEELFCIGNRGTLPTGSFPEYSRIIPKEVKRSIPFSEASHVNGIFATNGVLVDNKYIPKKFGVDFHGYIGINDSNLPVTISSEDKSVMLVIMPIIDNFFNFTEEQL